MLPRGRIKESPEDFVVEEIRTYEPLDQGDHLFLRFTKRGMTTDDAVRAIGRALAANQREIGVAGMKDKVAITTQTISLPIPRAPDGGAAFLERARSLALPGITLHEARRHPHKLKTGHLLGNRFSIRVAGLDPARVGEVVATLERLGREGLPNAFGAQRFGRDRDNADRARAWLSGRAKAPRDPRLRRLLWSALQSEMFNAVLEARVQDGTWAVPQLGDLVKRRTSGGLFLCADVQMDQQRALEGEISPTGPIFGVKMRKPEGEPARLEERIVSEMLGENVDLAATRTLGEGSRRALRLWIEELRVESSGDGTKSQTEPEQEASLRVYFVLPKGAYATTVLGAAVAWDSPDGRPCRETANEASHEAANEIEPEHEA